MTSFADHLLLHSIGLLALGAVAMALSRLWRRDPISSYGFHRCLLYAALALPLLQLGLAGRVGADAWTPLRGWWPSASDAGSGATARAALLHPTPVASTNGAFERGESRARVDPEPRGSQVAPGATEARHARARARRTRTGAPVLASIETRARTAESVEGPGAGFPWAWIFALGASLVAGWHLLRLRATQRMLARCEPLRDAEVLDTWQHVARDSRLRERVRLLSGEHLQSPGCFGLVRPVLVVPASAGRPEDRAALECALLHELVHLERGDARVAFLAAIARALFWFHPVVWWITKKLEHLRESSCDLAVVRRTGRPKSYALALLSYAFDAEGAPRGQRLTGWSASRSACPTLLHWTHSPSQLRRRIEMLANQRPAPSRAQRVLTFGLAAVALSSLWSGQLAAAAVLFPKDEEPTKAELEAKIAALQERADDLMAELDALLATVDDLTASNDLTAEELDLEFLGGRRIAIDGDEPRVLSFSFTPQEAEQVIVIHGEGGTTPRRLRIGPSGQVLDLALSHDHEDGDGAIAYDWKLDDGQAGARVIASGGLVHGQAVFPGQVRIRADGEVIVDEDGCEIAFGEGEDFTFDSDPEGDAIYEWIAADEDGHERRGYGLFEWRSDDDEEDDDSDSDQDGPHVLRIGSELHGFPFGSDEKGGVWAVDPSPGNARFWKLGTFEEGAGGTWAFSTEGEDFPFGQGGAWISDGGVHWAEPDGSPNRSWIGQRASGRRLGVSVESPGAALAGHLDIDGSEALVITTVEDGGRADEAGLKVHDVIVSISGQPSANYASLRAGVEAASEKNPLKLGILRKGDKRKVVIRFEDEPAKAPKKSKVRFFQRAEEPPKAKAKPFVFEAPKFEVRPRVESRPAAPRPERTRLRFRGDDEQDVRRILEKALEDVEDESARRKIERAIERLQDSRRAPRGFFYEETAAEPDEVAPAAPRGTVSYVAPDVALHSLPSAVVLEAYRRPAMESVELAIPGFEVPFAEPLEAPEPIALDEPLEPLCLEPTDVPCPVETPKAPEADEIAEPVIDVTELAERLTSTETR